MRLDYENCEVGVMFKGLRVRSEVMFGCLILCVGWI